MYSLWWLLPGSGLREGVRSLRSSLLRSVLRSSLPLSFRRLSPPPGGLSWPAHLLLSAGWCSSRNSQEPSKPGGGCGCGGAVRPDGGRLSLPRPSLLSRSFSSLSKRSLSLRSSSVSGGMSAIVRTRGRPRNSGLRRGPGLGVRGPRGGDLRKPGERLRGENSLYSRYLSLDRDLVAL